MRLSPRKGRRKPSCRGGDGEERKRERRMMDKVDQVDERGSKFCQTQQEDLRDAQTDASELQSHAMRFTLSTHSTTPGHKEGCSSHAHLCNTCHKPSISCSCCCEVFFSFPQDRSGEFRSFCLATLRVSVVPLAPTVSSCWLRRSSTSFLNPFFRPGRHNSDYSVTNIGLSRCRLHVLQHWKRERLVAVDDELRPYWFD